jgi:adenylate cyclase
VEQAEIEHARRKPTASLYAYDYFLHGEAHECPTEADANDEAKLFYHAIDLDPDFAPALPRDVTFVARRSGG